MEALLADDPLTDNELLELVDEMDDNMMDCSDTEYIENSSQFNPEKLAEGIDKAEALCNFFIDNDPSLERAVAFKTDLTACMNRYMALKRNPDQENGQQPKDNDLEDRLQMYDGKVQY